MLEKITSLLNAKTKNLEVVVAIKDNAMTAFQAPRVVPATGIAIRMFTDAINNSSEQNQMFQHPNDFELWHLGFYDPNEGTFEKTTSGRPERLLTGNEVKIR